MESEKKHCTAIVLAAGSGRRMKSNMAKQYLMLQGRPVICHSLQAFEDSPIIDDIILVVGAGEEAFARREIVEKYGFSRVKMITEGGAERYLSVEKALEAAGKMSVPNREGLIFIHDGARPLVTEKIIEDTCQAARIYGACCAAVPVKDTIKIADQEGIVAETPDRSRLFSIQTPQVFSAPLIYEAYGQLIRRQKELDEKGIRITDDAMVVEQMLRYPVKLVVSSYENIKITTPGDLEMAEFFLKNREK